MTVAEVAAVGVATLFIPLPHAIADHQSANARFLSDCHGAWMKKQSELSVQWLAQWLSSLNRTELAGLAGPAPEQIGRSSWRERVCQYCEISVVAVSLKKQKKLS